MKQEQLKTEIRQLCSTPCGITEAGIRTPGNRPRNPGTVLNALRHHGGRHAEVLDAGHRDAEVLNALRHHGGRHIRRAGEGSAH